MNALNAADSEFVVQPDLAPRGLAPVSLGAPEYLEVGPRGYRYLAEAWKLTDGGIVVVVRGSGGPSLTNEAKRIAEAVANRWGAGATIIEDWAPEGHGPEGERFRQSSGDGINSDIDADLAARELILP